MSTASPSSASKYEIAARAAALDGRRTKSNVRPIRVSNSPTGMATSSSSPYAPIVNWYATVAMASQTDGFAAASATEEEFTAPASQPQFNSPLCAPGHRTPADERTPREKADIIENYISQTARWRGLASLKTLSAPTAPIIVGGGVASGPPTSILGGTTYGVEGGRPVNVTIQPGSLVLVPEDVRSLKSNLEELAEKVHCQRMTAEEARLTVANAKQTAEKYKRMYETQQKEMQLLQSRSEALAGLVCILAQRCRQHAGSAHMEEQVMFMLRSMGIEEEMLEEVITAMNAQTTTNGHTAVNGPKLAAGSGTHAVAEPPTRPSPASPISESPMAQAQNRQPPTEQMIGLADVEQSPPTSGTEITGFKETEEGPGGSMSHAVVGAGNLQAEATTVADGVATEGVAIKTEQETGCNPDSLPPSTSHPDPSSEHGAFDDEHDPEDGDSAPSLRAGRYVRKTGPKLPGAAVPDSSPQKRLVIPKKAPGEEDAGSAAASWSKVRRVATSATPFEMFRLRDAVSVQSDSPSRPSSMRLGNQKRVSGFESPTQEGTKT